MSCHAIADVSGNSGGSVCIRAGRFMPYDGRVRANSSGSADGRLIDTSSAPDINVRAESSSLLKQAHRPAVLYGAALLSEKYYLRTCNREKSFSPDINVRAESSSLLKQAHRPAVL